MARKFRALMAGLGLDYYATESVGQATSDGSLRDLNGNHRGGGAQRVARLKAWTVSWRGAFQISRNARESWRLPVARLNPRTGIQ